MDPRLHLTMFTSICKHELPKWVKMSTIAKALELSDKKYGPLTITKIVPKTKGRLGIPCTDQEPGSIAISIRYKDKFTSTYRKSSVLLFRSSMRVCGGVPKNVQVETQKEISLAPLTEYCKMITEAIHNWTAMAVTPGNVKFVLINAITRTPPIDNFQEICRTVLWNDKWARVDLPFMHESGAIATCHVYPLSDSKCSAKVSHSGAIQYLGFKEIDMLHVFSEMIKKDLQ